MGLTISSPDIAQIFNATKAPYNISTPTSLLGRSALRESGLQVMKTHVDMIRMERTRLEREIRTLGFVSTLLGSHDANFILAQVVDEHGQPSNARAHFIYKCLAEGEGVVIRFRGMELHCTGCLRITVGTKEENSTLLDKLRLFETRDWKTSA